jgi:radical SAM superfamily enzyme YgiQ (UPF0313 family)
MKTFKDFLAESKKTYPFKVGVAGELPKDFDKMLKTALEKFGLSTISTGKTTPIQDCPLDFPQLENIEVTFWDIEVDYPTTNNILAEYLGNFCTVHRSKIVVRNPNSSVSRQQEDSGQSLTGESRIMELLKELEKDRNERGESGGFKIEAPADETGNVKSVVGK